MAVPVVALHGQGGTPCQARNVAAESPTRLPPTIRTSVSMIMPVPVSGQSQRLLTHRGRFGKPALPLPFPDHAKGHWWSMIPRVEPEGMLFGKPASTFPDHAKGIGGA